VTDLTTANRFNFDLLIVAQQTTSANHDPSEAVTYLTNTIQDVLITATGNEIPASEFRVTFKKPTRTGSSSDGFGHFECSIPGPLNALIVELTPPKMVQADGGRLEITGDGKGNTYKLIYRAVDAPELFKDKKEKGTETQWLHLIPRRRTNFGERPIYKVLVPHLAKYGLSVMKADKSFHIMMERGGEQNLGKYHCDFDVDWNGVPKLYTPQGDWLYNLHGLETLILDPETKETADIWMPPETAKRLFNTCNICFKPLVYQCKGCDPQADKKKNAMKRMEKAEAHRQAQARKSRKANMTFAFNP